MTGALGQHCLRDLIACQTGTHGEGPRPYLFASVATLGGLAAASTASCSWGRRKVLNGPIDLVGRSAIWRPVYLMGMEPPRNRRKADSSYCVRYTRRELYRTPR